MPPKPVQARSKPPATLSMVAQRAGVSRQTVSNALNAPERLAPDTLQRVRKAVDDLNYRPNRAARSLRTRSSLLIGHAIEPARAGVSNPVGDHFLHALSACADEAGYRILLFAAPPGSAGDPAPYEQLLDEHSVDAFVLSNTERGDRRPAWLRRRGIPFVAFGRSWSPNPVGDWVDIDGAHGTRLAAEHLVERGHRRVGFLGWPRGTSGAGDDRASGWREVLREHGLPTRGLRAAALNDVSAAEEAAQALLDADVTAVVCASDTLALGCYRALRARGRTPGADVAVVGFDDSPAAALLTPALSSLRQPLDEVGRACIRILLARIRTPKAPPERILLAPRLIVRESSESRR